jgi:hypothetical protein
MSKNYASKTTIIIPSKVKFLFDVQTEEKYSAQNKLVQCYEYLINPYKCHSLV